MRHPSTSPTASGSGVAVVPNHQQQTDSCGIGAQPPSAVTPARVSADLPLAAAVCDSGLGSSAGGVGRATTATPTPAG